MQLKSTRWQRVRLRAERVMLPLWLGLRGERSNEIPTSGVRVMVYHNVAERVIHGLNSRFLPLSTFREHVAVLKRRYQVVTLKNLFAGEYDKKRLAIALTFDDGLANNLRHALPVLEQHQVPATFFVTAIRGVGRDILWPDLADMTALTGAEVITVRGEKWRQKKGKYFHAASGKTLHQLALSDPDPETIPAIEKELEEQARFREDARLEDYWRVMTKEEIQQLASSPMAEIGSHGTRHYNLATLDKHAAEEDLRFAKQWLETVTGKTVESLAFPVGQYNAVVRDMALSQGYTRLLLDSYLSDDDRNHPRMKDRFGVHPFISPRLQWHYLNKGYY